MARRPDEDLFEWCRKNGALLLTADKRLTKYRATQQASSPSVVIASGYLLDSSHLEADRVADLDAIGCTINEGHAVFSMGPDRPTRAQLLPLISGVG